MNSTSAQKTLLWLIKERIKESLLGHSAMLEDMENLLITFSLKQGVNVNQVSLLFIIIFQKLKL